MQGVFEKRAFLDFCFFEFPEFPGLEEFCAVFNGMRVNIVSVRSQFHYLSAGRVSSDRDGTFCVQVDADPAFCCGVG